MYIKLTAININSAIKQNQKFKKFGKLHLKHCKHWRFLQNYLRIYNYKLQNRIKCTKKKIV